LPQLRLHPHSGASGTRCAFHRPPGLWRLLCRDRETRRSFAAWQAG